MHAKKYRKIGIIAIWTLLIPSIGVVLGFASASRNKMVCKGIECSVETSENSSFITEKEILTVVTSTSNKVEGRRLGDINFRSIESRIARNPWIAEASVFPTLNGKLNIKARPREAVLRVVNKWGEQFYIDRTGVMFPTRAGHPARVMVASGNITTRYIKNLNINTLSDSIQKKSLLSSVVYLNKILSSDKLLSAMMGQIFVNNTGDLELIPITGNHTVVLGDTSNLEQKLGKLIVFYDKILKTKGWDQYKTINLKFANQIVCSK